MKRDRPLIPLAQLLSYIRDNTIKKQVRKAAILERATRLATDADVDKRLKECCCPVCYYGETRMYLTAMTIGNCRGCNKSLMSGSSHLDEFCLDCASTYHMCRECGADLDLRTRKKL